MKKKKQKLPNEPDLTSRGEEWGWRWQLRIGGVGEEKGCWTEWSWVPGRGFLESHATIFVVYTIVNSFKPIITCMVSFLTTIYIYLFLLFIRFKKKWLCTYSYQIYKHVCMYYKQENFSEGHDQGRVGWWGQHIIVKKKKEKGGSERGKRTLSLPRIIDFVVWHRNCFRNYTKFERDGQWWCMWQIGGGEGRRALLSAIRLAIMVAVKKSHA